MNTSIALAAGNATAADFSNDTIWIVILKAASILVFLLVSVLFALWFERRLIARFQQRTGPNWAGPAGSLQALADAGKLLLKEDITVKAADRVIYLLAPVISVVCAFMVFAVIPFGPEVSIFGVVTPLQLTDFPVALLYILAVTGLGVYGLVLGGWSSGSTYPLLGSIRSTAQVISYELAMSLSLVSVLLVAGSMSTSEIVSSQDRLWWGIMLLPAFIVYLISMVGETNRLPFDLPEAEGELVGGFQTEYSSMKFAWFYLAEYINMLNVSAVATTLFLGGWRAPWPLSAIGDGVLNTGWWPVLWFLIKLWLLMGLFVWLRGTLLRFRYDQFMNLGWKVLIPIALGWLVILSLWQGLQHFGVVSLETEIFGLPARVVMFVLAGILAAIAIFLAFRAEKPTPENADATSDAPPEVIDPYAGGFPVPPLPGQTLPPSARKARVTTPAPADEEKNDD